MITRVERMMVGPIEAAELLQYNTHNRNPNLRRIASYARAMREGRWADTGIPIIMYEKDDERVLEDGQNRLMAIISSGSILPLHVSYTDTHIFDKIDQGGTRTLVQIIGITGVDNASLEATIAAAVALLDYGVRGSDTEYRELSASERFAHYLECPNDVAWAKELYLKLRRSAHVHASAGFMAAAIHIHRTESVEATRFFDAVATGENLRANDPAYVLRKYVLEGTSAVGSVADVSGRDRAFRWYRLTVRAWNYYVEGKHITRITASGTTPRIRHFYANDEVAS